MKNYRNIFKKHYGIEFGQQYDIHHIDLNHNNNEISNLLLLPKKLHQEYHNALIDYLRVEKGFITEIVGFTDMGSSYNNYAVNIMTNFYEVYYECQKWKDYKRYLDGEIPNIHNIEVE